MTTAPPRQPPRLLTITAALWLAMAGQASADKLVSVMTLLNDSGNDGVALALTEALREAARQETSWHVNDTKLSLSQLALVHDCEPTEAECLETIAEAIDAGLIMMGTMAPTNNDQLTVRLQLYERGKGFREEVAYGDFPATDPDYAKVAMKLLRQLQPEQDETAPAVEVAPISAVADEGPNDEPDMAAIEMSIDESKGDSLAWLGYTLIGVGVVSAGLVAYSWIQINEAQEDTTFVAYRESVGNKAPGADVCDEAEADNDHGLDDKDFSLVKDLCDQGGLFDVLQYVFLGTAVLAGAAGGIILWQDGSESASAAALTLQPHVARRSFGLTARLRM